MLKSFLLPSWLHSGRTFVPQSGWRGPSRAATGKARTVLRPLTETRQPAPLSGPSVPARPPPPRSARARGAHVPPPAAQVVGGQPARPRVPAAPARLPSARGSSTLSLALPGPGNLKRGVGGGERAGRYAPPDPHPGSRSS